MTLITEYSAWYILLCLAAGLAYAFGLYYREKAFVESGRWVIRALFLFRVLMISMLAYLLLSPFIKTITSRQEKPLVLIAQDASQSIIANKDSLFMTKTWPGRLDALVEKLSDRYEVQRFVYGESVNAVDRFSSISYKDKQTDMAAVFTELDSRYANRNIGALIIAGDGLYNKGASPVYASERFKAPIYTVALGDTSLKKDLRVVKVMANKTALLGNVFPVDISLQADRCLGGRTRLTLREDTLLLFSKDVLIQSASEQKQEHVVLEAKAKGIHHYRIALEPINGEATILNNAADFFVEVIEEKQKVLILAAAPHPDITAIRQSLEEGSRYEVNVAFPTTFKGSFKDYKLVVLHQLPDRGGLASGLLAALKTAAVPVWFILGSQSDLNAFSAMQSLVNVRSNLNKTNEVGAQLAKDFSLFTLRTETAGIVDRFPPLQAPFGAYQISPGASVLLNQQQGQISTQNPLWAFFSTPDARYAVLAGEGVWRWRLQNFATQNNHDAFNELVLKTVQYLSSKEDKSPLRVLHKSSYLENEALVFDGELYNEAHELVNAPELKMNIIDTQGKSFSFAFSRTERGYVLNAGLMPPGRYRFDAAAILGSRTLQKSGEFVIMPLQAEFVSTSADLDLMYLLAQRHDGALFGVDQLDSIIQRIEAREDVKPVVYTEQKLSELINLKALFFLLLLLLSAEWFLRKRSGSY